MLLSDTARRQAGKHTRGNVFPVDQLVGDGDYVFLSLGAPVVSIPEGGYSFVFDALQIVRDYEVKVGVTDSITPRKNLVLMLIANEEYDGTPDQWVQEHLRRNDVDDLFIELDQHLRLQGKKAIQYITQVCDHANPPDILKEIRQWADWWALNWNLDDRIYIPSSVSEAEDLTEIMVPEALPISDAVGVCYAKVYFEMTDFLRLLGNRKSLPKVHSEPEIGFPYRCPFCSGPIVKGDTLLQVIESRPWVRIVTNGDIDDLLRCASCGIYVKRGGHGVDFIELDKKLMSYSNLKW